MPKPRPTPSAKLRKFLAAYGTVHSAAVAWGVDYQALNRYLNGDCGLSLLNALRIAASTKVAVDDLFEPEQRALAEDTTK